MVFTGGGSRLTVSHAPLIDEGHVMRTSRRLLGLLVLVASCCTVASTSLSASATVNSAPRPVSTTPAPSSVSATATDLAAEAISEWVAQNKWTPIGNIVEDQTAKSVTVYATDALPAGLQQVIAGLSAGVSVSFVPSKYNEQALILESQRIATSANSAMIQSVGQNTTANGLMIGPTNPAVVNSPSLQAALIEAIGTGFPVSFVAPHVDPAAADGPRNLSTSPIWGGSLITGSAQGESCGTGAAIFNGSGANRLYGVTTAAHCQSDHFYAGVNRTDTLFEGQTHVLNISGTNDAQWLIGGPAYGDHIFGGPWNSSGNFAVRNGGDPAQGSSICMSGSVTGDICGQVGAVNQFMDSNMGKKGPGFFVGKSPSCAITLGDSGSPAYIEYTDSTVTIRGFKEIASDPVSSCQGNPNPKFQAHYGTAFMMNVSSELAQIGNSVALLTESNK